MKCFIATALGHKDVDDIYNKAVHPILKEFSIRPLRIDRIEHNDDIDDKIFQLLNESDLCIADLTYARPSVYYEAGYAFASGKPVIYISRKDHFITNSGKVNDDLRIHFDLQMKNIIPWTSPNDIFRSKLSKRINFAIRQLLIKKKNSDKLKSAQIEFQKLSQIEQLILFRKKVYNLLRVRSFRKIKLTNFQFDRGFIPVNRIKGSICQQVIFQIYPSINKSILKLYRYNPLLFIPFITQEEDKLIKGFEFYLLLFSLNPMRNNKLIGEMFPNYKFIGKDIFSLKDYHGKKESITKIIIIDNIKSLVDFNSRKDIFLSIFDTNY